MTTIKINYASGHSEFMNFKNGHHAKEVITAIKGVKSFETHNKVFTFIPETYGWTVNTKAITGATDYGYVA